MEPRALIHAVLTVIDSVLVLLEHNATHAPVTKQLLETKLTLLKLLTPVPKIQEPEPDIPGISDNKRKILSFIKKSPRTRARDILDEFSILSARTVKRNLQELLRDGLLRRSAKNGAVLYSVAD